MIRKFIGSCIEDIDRYPLDFCSINHFISGIIAYFIGFWLFYKIFGMNHLSAILLSYVCSLLGGLIWEFFENIFIIDMKKNKRQDSPINSLTDVVLVFLGSILGCYTFELGLMFNTILITGLLVLYGLARLFT